MQQPRLRRHRGLYNLFQVAGLIARYVCFGVTVASPSHEDGSVNDNGAELLEDGLKV